MKRRLGIATALAALTLTLAACSARGPAFAQMGPDEVMQRALEALAERDWSDAIAALEHFVFQYPTHARQPEARYQLGQAHFGRDDFILAANEFTRLADDYPAGPWADDARFMVCRSYQELSPDPPLDQEYTFGAIDHCNSLLAYYPDSEHAAAAREIVAAMTNKLARKELRQGEFYYKRGAYDSAVQTLEGMLTRYPTSSVSPAALLRLYEAYRKLGYDTEASETRERLLRDFPQSEEARRLGGATVIGRP